MDGETGRRVGGRVVKRYVVVTTRRKIRSLYGPSKGYRNVHDKGDGPYQKGYLEVFRSTVSVEFTQESLPKRR